METPEKNIFKLQVVQLLRQSSAILFLLKKTKLQKV